MLDATEVSSPYQPSEEEKGDEAATTRLENDSEVRTILHLKTEFSEVYRKFAQVCTELKLLYVAVTRPRKLLIIYDDDFSIRNPLQKHWAKVGVVDIITPAMVADPATMSESVAHTLRIGDEMSSTQRTTEA